MKKRVLIVAVLALTACKSEAQRLEEQYRIAEADDWSKDDECEIAAKVRDAYLEEGKADDYRHWSIIATACDYGS